MPKFHTTRGRLTAYSFVCGYIEEKSTNPAQLQEQDLYTQLYHEGAVFHVRQLDRRPNAKRFRTMWECFERLSDARKHFNKQPGKILTPTLKQKLRKAKSH